MATDNSELNVVAIGASAGGVEALKDLVLAEGPTVYRVDRAADE